MFKSVHSVFGCLAMAAGINLFLGSFGYAEKPSKPGGGVAGDNYRLIQLPDAAGAFDREGYAMDINNQRAVVGGVEDRAYLWELDNLGHVVKTVPLAWSADPLITRTVSRAVNETGAVVGSGTRGEQAVPLVWIDPATANLAPLELPLLETDASGEAFTGGGVATDINQHGLVTGWLSDSDPNGYDYVVVWQINLDPLDPWFGSVEAGPLLIAEAQSGILSPSVNDNGNVVATIGMASPTVWRWRAVFDPESLLLEVVDSEVMLFDAEVYDINEHDDICGVYFDLAGAAVAYVQDSDGILHPMPDIVDNKRRGTRNYAAGALNDGDGSGFETVQVVGAGLIYDKRSTGVISHHHLMWRGTSVIDVDATTNLGGAVLNFSYLEDVNNAGWILPYSARTSDGGHRAVVLMPLK